MMICKPLNGMKALQSLVHWQLPCDIVSDETHHEQIWQICCKHYIGTVYRDLENVGCRHETRATTALAGKRELLGTLK